MSSTVLRRIGSTLSRTRDSKLPPAGWSFAADRIPGHSGGGDRCHRRCASTYYDSQSGLHLPVHDETEIRLFLDVSTDHWQTQTDSDEPFVPHTLNKDRVEADEVSEKLQGLVQKGIHGVILPAIKFPRDIRNLQTLAVIAPPDFVVLSKSNSETTNDSSTVDDALRKAKEQSSSATNFSKVLNYQNEEAFRAMVQHSVEKGLHTTLSVGEDIYASNEADGEPITLANNIASMIDAVGGCDYIWISSQGKAETNTSVADTMVQVCEELVYLDVAGATIKSRLLVDSLNEDMLEDIMFAGVNKYVIGHEEEAEMVERVANEQGKTLLRS